MEAKLADQLQAHETVIHILIRQPKNEFFMAISEAPVIIKRQPG
jgi:hypothetical protein